MRTLAIALALVALPVPAAAQDMCAALGRIEAASREPMPFVSLAEAARQGNLVPGYAANQCGVEAGRGISCYRNIAPANLEMAALERTLRDCLGRAPVWRLGPYDMYREHDVVFLANGLRYKAHTMCDRRCRAGLIAWFEIRFEGEGPADDAR